MQLFLCFLLFLGFCFGCSRPPHLVDNQYSVTAMMNDSTWFGTVTPARIYESKDKRCKGQQFMLIIRTDILYKGMPPTRKTPKPDGCITGDCYSTQVLNLDNIPLKRGRYRLPKVARCGTLNNLSQHYWQTFPGNGTFRAFGYQKSKPNWVRVNRIDYATNIVEGQFALTLTDTSKQVIRFRDGLFRLKFKPE